MSKPVCTTCNDTHEMWLTRDGEARQKVSCTACPTPCPRCRGKFSAYCATTPCVCACHVAQSSAPKTRHLEGMSDDSWKRLADVLGPNDDQRVEKANKRAEQAEARVEAAELRLSGRLCSCELDEDQNPTPRDAPHHAPYCRRPEVVDKRINELHERLSDAGEVAEEFARKAREAESALSTATARIAELEAEVERMKVSVDTLRSERDWFMAKMPKLPEER